MTAAPRIVEPTLERSWLRFIRVWAVIVTLVAVRIVMPSDVTPAERELYENLKALRGDNPRAYLG